jgi:hypothetical protein
MTTSLKVRIDLKRAQKLAKEIVAERGMNARMTHTLTEHIVCEARDLRPSQIRRIIGKRRRVVSLNNQRWWDRRDDDPALDELVWKAVDRLKDEVPA